MTLVRAGYTIGLEELSDEEVFLRVAILERMLEEEKKAIESSSSSKGSVSRFG